MFDRYKVATTREKCIRRIVESLLLMIFGIYMIFLFNIILGIIIIAISSIIVLLHLRFLSAQKNSLSSLEIKVTTEKK